MNDDILGSMEFACAIAKSKIIVVLGHTKCGAITGACNNVKSGHFTGLLQKILPAIDMESQTTEQRNGENIDFVNRVSRINVSITMEQIRKRSPILRKLEANGLIIITGGLYDIDNGLVTFF